MITVVPPTERWANSSLAPSGPAFHGAVKNTLTYGTVRHYLTEMKTTVSSKGQIVLPAEIRQLDRIIAGQQFSVERLDAGEYLIRKIPLAEKTGIVGWLMNCPETDWFKPLVSESTDLL